MCHDTASGTIEINSIEYCTPIASLKWHSTSAFPSEDVLKLGVMWRGCMFNAPYCYSLPYVYVIQVR